MKKISIILPVMVLSCWSWTALLAAEDKAKKESDIEATVTPVVTYVGVSGNASKFREDTWMRDGLSGGVQDFKIHQQVGKDGYFNAEGHAIYGQRDYDIRLELVKPDFGFLRAGITQYPKYFDNMGGYYAPFLNATNLPATKSPFARAAFSLGSYPQMDIGKIYFDAGLTLPNLPKIEFGYEHQYKDGTKSLLEWGGVTAGLPAGPPYPGGASAVSKGIYPAFKSIDERVDIFKLGVEHTLGPIELGDNFYFEKYSNDTGRSDDGTYYIIDGSQKTVNVQEQYHHDLFSNTYHMEHHVNDKVYWSMGHMFTSFNGDAGYGMQTLYTPTVGGAVNSASKANDKNYSYPTIFLQQESHVGNFNVMVGPFSDFTAYAGIQGEKTANDSSSIGNNATFPIPTSNMIFRTSVEKRIMDEHIGFRFTKIPFTTVYTEAKWAQEDITEQVFATTAFQAANTGLTEDSRKQDYKAGFTTSPLSRMTLTGQYRNFRTDNVTTLYTTNVVGIASPYAGTLHDLSFQGNEVTTKLSVRPCSRVSVTLKYQMLSEDIYDTTKTPAPAGYLQTVDYYANIYSLGVTVTPMNRLYLTGLVSYQDTVTTAFDNNLNAVTPYKGKVYTVNGTAGYVIDNKTDLTAEYNFSHTDNYINNGSGTVANSDYSVPYLLSNDLHSMNLRLTRRITENIAVGLRYGFYKYSESFTGGINDYTAHLASASCTIRF